MASGCEPLVKPVVEFHEKKEKASAAGNAVDSLKEWLQNLPYKLKDQDLKVS